MLEEVEIRLENGETYGFSGTQTEVTRDIRTLRKDKGSAFEIVGVWVRPSNHQEAL